VLDIYVSQEDIIYYIHLKWLPPCTTHRVVRETKALFRPTHMQESERKRRRKDKQTHTNTDRHGGTQTETNKQTHGQKHREISSSSTQLLRPSIFRKSVDKGAKERDTQIHKHTQR
jgi:hypothetical protein